MARFAPLALMLVFRTNDDHVGTVGRVGRPPHREARLFTAAGHSTRNPPACVPWSCRAGPYEANLRVQHHQDFRVHRSV